METHRIVWKNMAVTALKLRYLCHNVTQACTMCTFVEQVT
jgi:hypothetical protein